MSPDTCSLEQGGQALSFKSRDKVWSGAPWCQHSSLHLRGGGWRGNTVFSQIWVPRGPGQGWYFLELSCFFHYPADVGNLISGSSAISKTSLNIRKRCARPSGVPRGPATSTGSLASQRHPGKLPTSGLHAEVDVRAVGAPE